MWKVTVWLLLVLAAGIICGQNIFRTTNLDQYYFNTTKGYIDNRLVSRINYNGLTFFAGRYLNNFFEGVDPNYFFFGGHPREVPGGNNEVKISYWLLPFFFLGILKQLEDKEKRVIIIYLLTLTMVSIFSVDALWWILVPFIYLTILYPIKELWRR